MGYLDNSTVVVDAILTKQGRKLLAQGQGLDIQYFSLTDTGIDYTLWNAGHTSGSAYYGTAIENLPMLEANPNGIYFMRNRLVTLNKNTTVMPLVTAVGDHNFGSVTAGLGAEYGWIPGLLGGYDETEGFYMLLPDDSVITVTNAEQVDVAGNAMSFLNEQDIPNAVMYKSNSGFIATPKVVTSTKTLTATFISISTGAHKSTTITVEKNDLQPNLGGTGGSNSGGA